MKRKRTKGSNLKEKQLGISPFEFEGLVSFEEIKSYNTLDGRCIETFQKKDKETRPTVRESVKLRKSKKKKNPKQSPAQNSENDEKQNENTKKFPKRKMTEKVKSAMSIENVKTDVDVEAWRSIFTPDVVIEAIKELGFKEPTAIQRLTIPAAIIGRKDIIGAAETGSGKTLAFVIPIIHGILRQREIEKEKGSQEVESEESDDESDFEMDGETKSEIGREGVSKMDDGDGEREDDIESDGENEDKNDSECEDELDNEGECEDNLDSESECDEEITSEDESESEIDMDKEGKNEFNGSESEAEEIENESGNEDESENESSNEDESENESGNENESENEQKLGCVKVIKNIKFDDDLPTSLGKDLQRHPRNKLRALIVTPTRELAVQIKKHTDAVLAKTDIRSAIVIGGLAQVKQDRVLKSGPEIVIGTPGRLWELVRQGNEHLSQLPFIRFLVIDETDRMLEKGHFQELKQLMGVMNSGRLSRQRRQNFVFSATLSLVNEPTKQPNKKKRKKETTKEMKLETFGKFIGVRESNCKTVDITRQFGTAEMLSEAKIFCEREEKDVYLYYFLRRFPARTLVFCNSITCVKRLHTVLSILQCNPYSLHAMKQQRQRLKNLDRFTANSVSVLLATDVAARGLDIPGVDHIIHYDVPYTAEIYVHRSGRTARANQEGISVLLIDSLEVKKYRQLCSTLKRTSDLTSFPVDDGVVQTLSKCVKLAKDIELMLRQRSKKRTNNSWIERNAKEAGILLSGDSEDSDDEAVYAERRKKKRADAELQAKREKLKSLLSKPLHSKILSHKYPTYSGVLNLPELMNVGSMLEPALNIMKNNIPQPKPNLPKATGGKKRKFKRRNKNKS